MTSLIFTSTFPRLVRGNLAKLEHVADIGVEREGGAIIDHRSRHQDGFLRGGVHPVHLELHAALVQDADAPVLVASDQP